MVVRPTSETKRIRYLLGLSSQAEREHIESEYFENDDAFQELLTAEDDLFDAYARDELTSDDRRIFETKFVTSWRGRDRLRFARAFAGTVSTARHFETKPSSTLFDILKPLQRWEGALRVAMFAAVLVLVVVLSWLVIDRRKLSNELRALREESAALSKDTEALRYIMNLERLRTIEITAQLENLQTQSGKPRLKKDGTTSNRRTLLAREAKNNRQAVANRRSEKEKKSRQKSIMNNESASVGHTSFRQQISELPVKGRSGVELLMLDPDYSVQRLARNRGNTITVPIFLSWIIFRLDLETAAQHTEYRVTIQTTDARQITSVSWIEALTPNQTRIDTPAISIADLASSNYMLLLEGKDSTGTYVKVAEYAFKVIKH